jgi:GH35 family endo-1,4-beta-xylanase
MAYITAALIFRVKERKEGEKKQPKNIEQIVEHLNKNGIAINHVGTCHISVMTELKELFNVFKTSFQESNYIAIPENEDCILASSFSAIQIAD